jgi:hypothetical protein
MRRKLSLLLASLVVGAFALLIASPVHAQATGNTTVSIDIPDIVILHYFTTVDVTIDAAAMGTYLTGAGTNAIDEGTFTGPATENTGQFEANLAIAPSALSGDPSNATLLLQDAWGVRAISLGTPTSETDLAIVVTNPNLTNAGSVVTIADAFVDDGTTAGNQIQFASPGLAPAWTGDVELLLDFSNTTAAGQHVGGVFTLTATNI